MRLVYFAWVRERVGRTDEEVEPAAVRSRPSPISCGWLRTRGEEYEYAFENEGVVRAAIDHVHVKTGCADCRSARDRVLPAHDRRLGGVDRRSDPVRRVRYRGARLTP